MSDMHRLRKPKVMYSKKVLEVLAYFWKQHCAGRQATEKGPFWEDDASKIDLDIGRGEKLSGTSGR